MGFTQNIKIIRYMCNFLCIRFNLLPNRVYEDIVILQSFNILYILLHINMPDSGQVQVLFSLENWNRVYPFFRCELQYKDE